MAVLVMPCLGYISIIHLVTLIKLIQAKHDLIETYLARLISTEIATTIEDVIVQ